MNALAITFFAVLAPSFGVFLLSTRAEPPSRVTQKRLVTIGESMRSHVAGIDGSELEKASPWGSSIWLDALLDRFRFAKKFKTLLLHANSSIGLGGAALATAGAGLTCGAIAYLLTHTLLVAGAATAAGAMIPYVVFRIQRSRRVKAFNEALPDAIDLMSRSLLAGHSMGSAIEMIAEQSPQPLAGEFVQVFQQQRLGLQFRDALLQMGSRVPSRDLQFLITAILVQKETGGDLTEILERASYVIRERVRIEGEVRTRTASGRLTGWILGLLPVILLVITNIVSPGYSSVLFHDPLGQKLLYTGGGLILLGGAIIGRIVDVQV